MGIFKYLLMALLTLNLAQAKEGVQGLKSLVEKVSKMTGVQYIYPSDMKGKVGLSKNFKLTKDNADGILSYVLSENGYTRIRHNEDITKIISSRDVRYNPTQIISASKSEVPKIPRNHDYFMMEYSLEQPGLSTEFTRSFRPFMSRYGRIIDVRTTNKIIIQDTGENIHRLYKLLLSMDEKPSSEQREKWEDEREFQRKLQMEKAKHCLQIKES